MERNHVFSMVLRQVERAAIWRHKRKGLLFLSDTTLRDGEQMPGVRLNPDEKVQIAQALARAGIHSIDAGFPAAAKEEVESIRRIAASVKGPVINGHCRTLNADIDAAAEALGELSFFKRAVTLFIGISPIHREQKHHKTKTEIIRMTVDAIQYAKNHFRIVTFGPEDASRTEPEFLHEIYDEAIMAGATTCGFADTVGFLTPGKAADCIKGIQDNVQHIDQALLAVHFHNDLGLGSANALACIKEGVNIVQGTVNGLGERAGNTPLEEVIMALTLHPDEFPVKCHVKPAELYELSRLVARLTGVEPAVTKDVIGRNVLLNNTSVENLCDAILLAIETPNIEGEAFNIRDERLVTRNEFINTIADYLGKPHPGHVPEWLARALVRPIEFIARLTGRREPPPLTQARMKFLTQNLDFSINKAKRILGYRPQVDFQEGIIPSLDALTGKNSPQRQRSPEQAPAIA